MSLPAVIMAIPKDMDIWQVKVFAGACYLLGIAALWRQAIILSKADKERDSLLAKILSNTQGDFPVKTGMEVSATVIPGLRSRSESLAKELLILLSGRTEFGFLQNRRTFSLYKSQFRDKVEMIANEFKASGGIDLGLEGAIRKDTLGLLTIDDIRAIAYSLFSIAYPDK